MKFTSFLKRILSFALICSMLVLACACGSGDNNNTEQPSDSNESETSEETWETDKPLLDTDILLSGNNAFRIVYSDGYKASAVKIQDKLMSLDESYKAGSSKYAVVKPTTAPDSTPEILIGDTNRPATEEAKKLISDKKNHYAVYVSDTAIAVYAEAKQGIEDGVKALIKNILTRGNAVIYDKTSGNIIGEYITTTVEGPAVDPNVKPTEATTAAAKSTIDASTLLNALADASKNGDLPTLSIAVSTTEDLKSTTIKGGNPCQNCYSVTKAYCVTAIGMLYDEGKIKVTDTIGSIFKEEIEQYGISTSKWANITIHDVMKHKAGFTQGGFLDIDSQDATKWASQDYLKLTLEAELDGKKGYMYTDGAYYLISRVVTKISGETLDVFLAKRLFNKTDCREFAFATCPMGYPIGATGLYIRSSDVAKLGRIYLNGGKYNGKQIISQDWVNQVIEKGYELNKSGTGYAKGGMRGQNLYINFKHNIAVAWHSYSDNTGALSSTLKSYMT